MIVGEDGAVGREKQKEGDKGKRQRDERDHRTRSAKEWTWSRGQGIQFGAAEHGSGLAELRLLKKRLDDCRRG